MPCVSCAPFPSVRTFEVVDAGARSLRMIYQSKLAPKFDFLEEENLKFILLLLNDKNENLADLAASIIKHSCKSREEQKALCHAGVLQRLVSLLEGSLCQRESSLDSITTVVKDNSEIASHLSTINDGRAVNLIVGMMKDRYPRTRFLSCACLIAIGKASPRHIQELEIRTKLILILSELLEEYSQVGDEALFTLVSLVEDKEDLHKQALSMNVIQKLCDSLHRSDINGRRLQGILLALAELCSRYEKSRDHVMSSAVLDLVFNALRHECADVRIAACRLISSISRSVKSLFAGHFSTESTVHGLVQLLQDSSIPVQAAALKAICNVVVNFKASKAIFIESGCVKQFVKLSKSTDSELRLNAVWALRNLAFNADKVCRERIIFELSENALVSLISDLEPRVQELALALIRNLVDGCVESIDTILRKYAGVLDAVVGQLQTSFPEVCTQAMFVLANIAAGRDFHKEAVIGNLLPPGEDSPPVLLKLLLSSDIMLRTVTVWCIINLTQPNCPTSSSRVSRLRDAGIVSQLKTMVNDSCLDVKFRVRSLLGQCNISDQALS
ncbi:ARM repeat superfamily protein isoform X2 [Wolffia australiana]